MNPDVFKRSFLVIDTETVGRKWLSPDGVPHNRREVYPFMVAAFNQDGEYWQWEWPVDPLTRTPKIRKKDLRDIKRLTDHYPFLVFHNATFDVSALLDIGLDLTHRWPDIHDTMLMAKAYQSDIRLKLKLLSKYLLDIPDDDEKELQKAITRCRAAAKKRGWPLGIKESRDDDKGSETVDYFLPRLIENSDLCSEYNLMDCKRTALLYYFLIDGIEHRSQNGSVNLWDAYKLEQSIMPFIMDMQRTGVTIHASSLKSKLNQCKRKQLSHEKAVFSLARKVMPSYDNTASHPQNTKLLFDHYKLPVLRTTRKGKPSIDANALNDLYELMTLNKSKYKAQLSLVENLIACRKYGTYVSYLEGYWRRAVPTRDKNVAKLHPSFHQAGTKFTRLSSTDPNGQNVGKNPDPITNFSLRSVFGPPPGWLWFPIDYSQIELRILARLANEVRMLEAFESGADIHDTTAKHFGLTINPRDGAKRINYAVPYGAGLSKITAIVQAYGGRYKGSNPIAEAYPDLNRYIRQITEEGTRQKYVTLNPGGYKLYLPVSDFQVKGYVGVNAMVQGYAGVIAKRAIARCGEYIRRHCPTTCKMILQVHDELVFAVRPHGKSERYKHHVARLAQEMERAGEDYGFTTPAEASIVTKSWDAKKDFDWHRYL